MTKRLWHAGVTMAALLALLAACEPRYEGASRTGIAHPAPAPYVGKVAAQPMVDLRFRNAMPVGESYQPLEENRVKLVAEAPISTFSVDVDTGAYSNLRRFLNSGQLPPADAVRIEELVNYFDYAYEQPADREQPFAVTTEVATTPWNLGTYLLRIGVKGYDLPRDERPPANLVFLVDVSGSMASQDKLPLVVASLKLLVERLTAQDRIAIVTYAGSAGTVLEPTPGNEKARIRAALDRLSAGGSTAGAAGIERAYALAEQGRIEGGVNRVILATDGDFNVGLSDVGALKDLVTRKRDGGITLTTLGFGTGNLNDHLMEQIADVGNGNYAYIDSLREARKVLVAEMSSTLFTIAKDVKIQVEFNPAHIAEYRLIGFENRLLAREDFSNDKVDAGDIGAGHSVTALYEITPVGSPAQRIAPLRYGPPTGQMPSAAQAGEFAFVKLRYKLPDGGTSRLLSRPLGVALLREAPFRRSSDDFRFAAAVAGFGQLLRGSAYTGSFGYGSVIDLARGARGSDEEGYRAEFIALAELAQAMGQPSLAAK